MEYLETSYLTLFNPFVRWTPRNTASTHWMGNASFIISLAVNTMCFIPLLRLVAKNAWPVWLYSNCRMNCWICLIRLGIADDARRGIHWGIGGATRVGFDSAFLISSLVLLLIESFFSICWAMPDIVLSVDITLAPLTEPRTVAWVAFLATLAVCKLKLERGYVWRSKFKIRGSVASISELCAS